MSARNALCFYLQFNLCILDAVRTLNTKGKFHEIYLVWNLFKLDINLLTEKRRCYSFIYWKTFIEHLLDAKHWVYTVSGNKDMETNERAPHLCSHMAPPWNQNLMDFEVLSFKMLRKNCPAKSTSSIKACNTNINIIHLTQIVWCLDK